jgi:hypothetical protein
MVVVFHSAIEPFLGTPDLEFLDQAAFGENLQIPVNGSQADPRESLTGPLIDLIGSGMRFDLLEFLQDDPPLSGHHEFSISLHNPA